MTAEAWVTLHAIAARKVSVDNPSVDMVETITDRHRIVSHRDVLDVNNQGTF